LNRQGQDRRVFQELIRFLDKKKVCAKSLGQLMLEIGKFFLGAPYMAGTLETKRHEHLIVNLREYDCVTFVESVIALAWSIKFRKKSFAAFRRLLQKIRYRQGRLMGYSSRLHYFSDWIHDNQKKDLVKDVTAEIGGRSLKKAITLMTAHPDLYPKLENAANLRRMKLIERKISKRSIYLIPKKALRRFEDRIRDGDLIAITTNAVGLDVQHAGFAAKVRNRIHLLHASSAEGKVVLSRKTLYQYLMQGNVRSGIMVAKVTMTLDA